MNYLDIVLIGYKSTNDFPQYIYREYKKAIDNHYSLKEFFVGCNNAVAHMASQIDDLYYKRIERLNDLINVIENDNNRSEEKKAIDIEKVNVEMKLVDKNQIGTPLLFLSNNRLTGHLYYNDIALMMHGLQEAIEFVEKDKIEQKLAKPNSVTIDFKEIYDEEVTEERKAILKAELSKFESIPEKIRYLETLKIEYLQNIPSRTFEVSGRIIGSGFPNGPLFFDRYIDLEIEKLKIELKSTNRGTVFESIFYPNNNSYKVCIDLLEDLEITVNGLNRLKSGKVGALIGAIVAMKETLNFFKQNFTEMELLGYFNSHLKIDCSTFNKRSNEFKASYPEAKAFIKTNTSNRLKLIKKG